MAQSLTGDGPFRGVQVVVKLMLGFQLQIRFPQFLVVFLPVVEGQLMQRLLLPYQRLFVDGAVFEDHRNHHAHTQPLALPLRLFQHIGGEVGVSLFP